MKSIQTEIMIAVSPEKVWNIIQDFENYGEWNPFITSIRGKTENNQTHFIHGETFSGILTKSILKKQGVKINCGFHAMNQALKQKAEQ